MNRIVLSVGLVLLIGATASSLSTAADPPLVVDLWPGKPADDNADSIGEEKFIELKVNGKTYEVAGKPTKWKTNVTKPTLTVYRPAADKNSGTAMLICPGGGYHNLGWEIGRAHV